MKKIYYILILIAGLVLCTGCGDFLDLNPKDKVTGSTFFTTEEELKQAVTATYVPLRDVVINEYYQGEMRSDNTHYEEIPTNRGTAYIEREAITDFQDASLNTYTNNVFYNCYLGISRVNIVIDHIDDAPKLSEDVRKNILGQVKFLRAYYYFKLVRYYGGVPLYLKEVTNTSEAFLPRSSADEVYNQIIEDAKDAVAMLAPPAKFPQTGEATKGSATMLLAEVYLYQKKYAEVETLLKTLSDMGYELLPDYAAVFSTNNKNSRESLFEVQYKEGLQGGQQSTFIYNFIPRSNNTSVITGVNTNNSTLGGYNVPTDDLLTAYEPGDKRKAASIAVAEGTYNTSYLFTYSANMEIDNYTPQEGKTYVPYTKKYLNPHANPTNTDDNWPIYRYAEALLFMAEALNEQNKPTEALGYLNPVRQRAGLSEITETNQGTLREIILKERRLELAFESKRWLDLVRTGKAKEVMTAYGIKMKQKYSYLSENSYIIDDFRLLLPLPYHEVDRNTKLEQNPGY
jgi:hypothetical protein